MNEIVYKFKIQYRYMDVPMMYAELNGKRYTKSYMKSGDFIIIDITPDEYGAALAHVLLR